MLKNKYNELAIQYLIHNVIILALEGTVSIEYVVCFLCPSLLILLVCGILSLGCYLTTMIVLRTSTCGKEEVVPRDSAVLADDRINAEGFKIHQKIRRGNHRILHSPKESL